MVALCAYVRTPASVPTLQCRTRAVQRSTTRVRLLMAEGQRSKGGPVPGIRFPFPPLSKNTAHLAIRNLLADHTPTHAMESWGGPAPRGGAPGPAPPPPPAPDGRGAPYLLLAGHDEGGVEVLRDAADERHRAGIGGGRHSERLVLHDVSTNGFGSGMKEE